MEVINGDGRKKSFWDTALGKFALGFLHVAIVVSFGFAWDTNTVVTALETKVIVMEANQAMLIKKIDTLKDQLGGSNTVDAVQNEKIANNKDEIKNLKDKVGQ